MSQPPNMKIVAFRAPPDLVDKLDAHLERERVRRGHSYLEKSEVCRQLLAAGLAAATSKRAK